MAKKAQRVNKSGKQNKKHSKQLTYVVVACIIIVVCMFIYYWASIASTKFEYLGLNFQKTNEGNLVFYKSSVQITQADGKLFNYVLNLRNDPRELDVPKFPIRFLKTNKTFISINPDIGECDDATLAFMTIGQFVGAMGIDGKGAFANKSLADEKQTPYVTCENSKTNTVLLFEAGNKTSIVKEGECYRIKIANCELVKAVEEIEVGAIASARGYIR